MFAIEIRADGVAIRAIPACPDCGGRTVTTHADGSRTCGRCYLQRARDLGVIR